MSHKTTIKSFGGPRDINTLKHAVNLRQDCLGKNELLDTMPFRESCEWLGWGEHRTAMLGTVRTTKGFGIRLVGSSYAAVLHVEDEQGCREQDLLEGGRYYQQLQDGKLELKLSADDMYLEEYEKVFGQLMANGGFYAQAAIIQEATSQGHEYELTRLTTGETVIEVTRQNMSY